MSTQSDLTQSALTQQLSTRVENAHTDLSEYLDQLESQPITNDDLRKTLNNLHECLGRLRATQVGLSCIQEYDQNPVSEEEWYRTLDAMVSFEKRIVNVDEHVAWRGYENAFRWSVIALSIITSIDEFIYESLVNHDHP